MTQYQPQHHDGDLLLRVLGFRSNVALEDYDCFCPTDLVHYNQIQLKCLRTRMAHLSKICSSDLTEDERYDIIHGKQFSQRFRAFYVTEYPEKVTRA
jgi:hypothetical protein